MAIVFIRECNSSRLKNCWMVSYSIHHFQWVRERQHNKIYSMIKKFNRSGFNSPKLASYLQF